MITSKEKHSSTEDVSASGKAGVGVSSLLLNQPIVMDIGTATIKAGFAGGSKPKVVPVDLSCGYWTCRMLLLTQISLCLFLYDCYGS
jgi:hypothetical protein